MPKESCDPLTYLVPGGFSKQNKVLANFSLSPAGISVCHNSIAFLRELVDIPLRSLNS